MEQNNIEFLSPIEIRINKEQNFKLITKKIKDDYLLAQRRRTEKEFYDTLLGSESSQHFYTI